MERFSGRTAVVTGGASGIGLAMARSLAREGMRVALLDVEGGALATAAAQVDGAHPIVADVSSRDAMVAAAAETVARFGRVDVLCNNAGVSVAGTVDRMQASDWEWVLGVNLLGVVNGLHAFLPHLRAHGEGGHVVNTASVAGLVADPAMSVYVASKFAVVGLSEAIRPELAPYGIGVTVLCPHAVATNIVQSRRNRPAHLQRPPRGDARSERDEAIRQMIDAAVAETFANALDPAVVGALVVEAIRHDDPYCFTHPEDRAAVEARHREILAAFDRWDARRARLGR